MVAVQENGIIKFSVNKIHWEIKYIYIFFLIRDYGLDSNSSGKRKKKK